MAEPAEDVAKAGNEGGAPRGERGFATLSGEPVEPVYRPGDLDGFDPDAKLGAPGAYPFTRGVYPSMYRGRLWTMRQFAGFGTPAETNERYRFLLERGQGGLSVAFDMPTLMGIDSDDPRAEGEVGRCGVATDTLEDFVTLFDRIPLGDISTSMTISGPAVVAFAFFLATAERQGVPWERLDGTLQTDIMKEYIAQKEWIFPPRPHLRLIGDLMAFCAEHVPRWHPVSVSGYHIREAGATAAQELAYTLADGFSYVELGQTRGLDVDTFAPGLSFFFNAHIDFFEEIAKLRAARTIWARWLRDRYGATDPDAMKLRFHTQTAGVSLTAQQPMNNVVRTTIEALAGVLGGTQSLHTNALDEVLALPTEDNAKLALRTQQVIAYESGVPDVTDPLAGSYFVETMTDRIEEQAEAIFAEIDRMGDGSMLEGVLTGIETGWFQQAIAESAFREQRRYESGDLTKVGVNAFVDRHDEPVETLVIGPEGEREQIATLTRLRAERDEPAGERGARRPGRRGRDRREPDPAPGGLRPEPLHGRRDRRGAHGRLRRLPRDTSVLGRGASSTNEMAAPAHNSTAHTDITHRKPSANDSRTASWICARSAGARPAGGDSAPCSCAIGEDRRLRTAGSIGTAESRCSNPWVNPASESAGRIATATSPPNREMAVFTPEAMPARLGPNAESTAVVSGATVSARPTAKIRTDGKTDIQYEETCAVAAARSKPAPATVGPMVIGTRGPTRSASRPAMGEPTRSVRVSGRRLAPPTTAE